MVDHSTQQTTTPGRARGVQVVRTVVDDVDGYVRSVAGIEIESVRAGRGDGPSTVLTVRDELVTTTACTIGFPMMSRTTVDDDRTLLAAITAAPSGSRWCEIDLEPGSVVAYGPGAEHTATNRPGLRFAFAIADLTQLERRADDLGLSIEAPSQGQVHVLARQASTEEMHAMLTTLADAADGQSVLSDPMIDDVLTAMTTTLTGPSRQRRVECVRPRDPRQVVNICIDYAEAIERIPSIAELCLVARVPERRLCEAFRIDFKVPPTRYFRAWALEQAHRRLSRSLPDAVSVTTVALDLGFPHLGRFAGQYKEIHGESPSTTLRSLTGVG